MGVAYNSEDDQYFIAFHRDGTPSGLRLATNGPLLLNLQWGARRARVPLQVSLIGAPRGTLLLRNLNSSDHFILQSQDSPIRVQALDETNAKPASSW